MTQPSSVKPSPFLLEGGSIGVLLIHGFTGSPPEMRPVGDYLNQRGLTVSVPCLPGHGTTLEDLNRQRWTDWTGRAAKALVELKQRCETVVVGGLSLGALISLYLVANTTDVAGAIIYSPAIMLTDPGRHFLPILKYLIRQVSKPEDYFTDPQAKSRLWSYDAYPTAASHEVMKFIQPVKQCLPQVTCPLLIIHSTADPTLHPDSARYVYERVGSTDKNIITLHNSGHVLNVDSEWERVAEETYQFILKHVSAPLKNDQKK
ncbi:MAG: alpha/beta fold hydrolase [Anaerolineales bacterium]|nr:alpha/beta fold hydrolase [Anaerolineales bacterium]